MISKVGFIKIQQRGVYKRKSIIDVKDYAQLLIKYNEVLKLDKDD